MEKRNAAHAFATLGHPDRLAVFRPLMRFAPQGARPTEIAGALGLKANTLSHHLSDLTSAGLAVVERQGRSLFHSVNLDAIEGLIGYLALDVGRARPDLLASLGSAAKETPYVGDKIWNVLFICSGNSARSLFAEALLRNAARPGPLRVAGVSRSMRAIRNVFPLPFTTTCPARLRDSDFLVRAPQSLQCATPASRSCCDKAFGQVMPVSPARS